MYIWCQNCALNVTSHFDGLFSLLNTSDDAAHASEHFMTNIMCTAIPNCLHYPSLAYFVIRQSAYLWMNIVDILYDQLTLQVDIYKLGKLLDNKYF